MHPVVFHIDELSKWGLLLKNVANLISAYGELPRPAAIEVVANAQAVEGYLHSGTGGLGARMASLQGQSVRFVACGNALRERGIGRKDLFSFVEVVPAGVRELVERQGEGYAYLKP